MAKGRAALLRFRQKAGLIRADSTVAWIAQQVQSERQVEFVTTAAETLPDGRHASTDPRVGIFHQARFSGIAARQVTGRTHRDHQVSPWQVAYAEGTVEEQVGKMMVERIAAASDSVGSDTTGLTELAQLLGADWLPPATMTAHDT